METLDLHGARHRKVTRLVENFILRKPLPLKIITGNSPVMQRAVMAVIHCHGLKGEPESFYNLGSIIVTEN